jgi:tryptophan synthase alpha chain
MNTPENRLSAAFSHARNDKQRAALVAYLTAGDPDLAATERFIEALARGGADVIELGVPFSDPLADGPTIQRAMERALEKGTSLRGALGVVERVRARGVTVPIVLFTYYNPIFVLGHETFARETRAAGVDGVLALDLPPEEAGDFRAQLAAAGLASVFLAAPTTDPARVPLLAQASTGFLYYVSRTGVTGVRAELDTSLLGDIDRLRAAVQRATPGLPVAVGFGISKPEHARAVGAHADGVVIGSRLVQIIEEAGADVARAARELEAFLAACHDAMKRV